MIVYKPLQHIRAITFDLDDTLYDNMPYIHAAEKALDRYLQKHYPKLAKLSKSDWRKIRKKALAEDNNLKNDIALLRRSVLRAGCIKSDMKTKKIEHCVDDCFNYFYKKRSDFNVDKDVRKTLKSLSKIMPIAAITNGNVNCESIGIGKYLSHILHASYEQPMKPHPAIFHEMASLLKIPAKNILHVGDNLEKDVFGSINAGYQSAWLAVDRPMKLKYEPVRVLPHIQLASLSDLKEIVRV